MEDTCCDTQTLRAAGLQSSWAPQAIQMTTEIFLLQTLHIELQVFSIRMHDLLYL